MRILHIVPHLDSGGVETGTIDLALSLKELGHAIVVISNGGRLVKKLEDNGILHIKLPVHRKSIASLFLIPKIARILQYHSTDVVHASSRVPAWIGFFASKLARVPFVTSCHGFYSTHFLSSVMGWGKFVMVISKVIEQRMVEDFKVKEDKIRLVYRGVDLSKHSYRAAKYDTEKSSYKIINVGRLTPIKGQDTFIKAIKIVLDSGKDVESWVVGGPRKREDTYLEKLKHLTKELKIEDRVKFLGRRDDVDDLLSDADCLVLSTTVPEGFGRTVIEAGASGTAVCASGVGGIQEIIEDGTSGLFFPPKDEKKQMLF